MSIQGIKELAARIKQYQAKAGKGTEIGLMRAGRFLQRESQKIVPVEFGNLKGSADTVMSGSGIDAEVVVSYGAEYAIYVHENLESRHRPGKTAKYLEIPLKQHKDTLMQIVADAVRDNTK